MLDGSKVQLEVMMVYKIYNFLKFSKIIFCARYSNFCLIFISKNIL